MFWGRKLISILFIFWRVNSYFNNCMRWNYKNNNNNGNNQGGSFYWNFTMIIIGGYSIAIVSINVFRPRFLRLNF